MMQELIRRYVFGSMLAVMVCGYWGEAYGTNGRPPEVTVSPVKAYVVMDANLIFTGSASDPDGTPIQAWRWWSDHGVPEEKRSPECTTSFTAKWLSAGQKTVKLYATDSDGSYGYGDDKTEMGWSTVYVIEVFELQIYTEEDEDWHALTGGTIYILKGSKYKFKAGPKPLDAPQWPSNQPTWSGIIETSGEEVEVSFPEAGSYSLTVKCGEYDTGITININVIAPQPASVIIYLRVGP